MKVFGLPNRPFFAVLDCILFMIVEIILNHIGVLTCDYSWWQPTFPWLLFLIGYLPFLTVCFWVYDMETVRKKLITVGIIFCVDILSLIFFGLILNWI